MRARPRPLSSSTVMALVCVGGAACHFGGPEPLPLRGATPALVAVWPHAFGASGEGHVDWFAGLGTELRRRGYGVVAPRVVRTMLVDAGLDPVEPSAAAAATLHADAVLELWVRTFDADGDGNGLQHARWDLEWRLVSQHGEGLQWRYAHHGTWRAADRARQTALERSEELGPAAIPPIVPIGGDGGPGFRDAASLLAFLHREAMQFLPERTEADR
ncbi:MAG: hypothetical protein H6835_08555 [Planctomycetes bacterium]|nr:hypothetical protein [Planctomycetota bacterium]